jgi:SAM-dependent methyltransferase
MSSSIWSAGRYESVAEHIATVAARVVAITDSRSPLRGATVVDLACGTGRAALAAAQLGAQVTGVDITADLIDQGAVKADAAGVAVTWRTADAADTGLPDASADAVISNMGIIFVEPQRQVTELARLLKPGGVLGFSSWVRDTVNPFFDPVVTVLGKPPARGFSPDQWGDAEIATDRLATQFDALEFTPGALTWRFDSHPSAMSFVTQESPMHVDVMGRAEPAQREALRSAFGEALAAHTDADGGISFDASYVVVTAVRR